MANTQPTPIEPSTFFSAEGKRLQNASLSGLVAQFAGMKVVALHCGLPPPVSFPLAGVHLDLAAGGGGGSVDITNSAALVAAQQYEFGSGNPQLLHWIQDTVQAGHAPPTPVAHAVTCGAVHALSLAASLLCDPGDWIVCDEFSYSHAIEVIFVPKGLRPLPVRMDERGMDPVHLRQQLQWAAQQVASGGVPDDGLPPPRKPPRVAYLIPTGHNPTGVTIPLDRKRELYQVCREFGLLLLEDDPYWWLHWGDAPATTGSAHAAAPAGPQEGRSSPPLVATTPPPAHTTVAPPGAAADPTGADVAGWYAAHLPPSFLSLDVDGRVLRVDTLSKVLSPGFRVGWVTGHPELLAKLALGTQASTVGTSPLAQVLVSSLLTSWGTAGWIAHLQRLQALYARKARVLEAAVAQHLPGLVKWSGVPGAGMFMWLELMGDPTTGAPPPSATQLARAMKDAGVVVVPGAMSWSDLGAMKAGVECPYLRLTFAFLEDAVLEDGVARLRDALVACKSGSV